MRERERERVIVRERKRALHYGTVSQNERWAFADILKGENLEILVGVVAVECDVTVSARGKWCSRNADVLLWRLNECAHVEELAVHERRRKS